MKFPYSILYRPADENPVFPEGFGLQLDTSQCPDLNQLRQELGKKVIDWVDRYGLVHFTHVNRASIPNKFHYGSTGREPTLWHVDEGSDQIVALGGHTGNGVPTQFVIADEAARIKEDSCSQIHLRGLPLFCILDFQTAYRFTCIFPDGMDAVILDLASEVSERAGSLVEIDWARYPQGMVFFRTVGLKGDRVLHGCFPKRDLDAMKRDMDRLLSYYKHLDTFFK